MAATLYATGAFHEDGWSDMVDGFGGGWTKTRILDAAEALFVSGGFESLSMRQITSAAGVNLAAVNYHFGSKDALIQAVLARQLDPLNEARVAVLVALEKDFGNRMTCEHVLVATMQGLYPDSTQQEVRRELDYLADRRLVHISGQHTGTWLAELARYGVDIVEYTVPCEPGIARPPKVV